MVGVSDHLIVNPICDDPLIFWILYFKLVDKLGFKIKTVFLNEILRLLSKSIHLIQVEARSLVLVESVLILALLLTHLAVVLVFTQTHFYLIILAGFN